MTWHTIKPTSTGGGRTRNEPAGRIYDNGQVTVNAAACEMLGYPARVLVQVDPDARRVRLTPTTPENLGGFSLSGGGNTPHRFRATEITKRWPEMEGNYTVAKLAGGIELRQEED